MVFGALAASAAAVNVALQFISGAVSLAGTSAADTAVQNRLGKRKYEEDDDSYMPAVISAMADDEAIARLGDYLSQPRSPNWWDEFWASDDHQPERWVSNFRVSRSTFMYICSLVKPDLESATPVNFMSIEGRFIPLEKQVAIALRRLASGYAHNVIGEQFGVGTSTVCKITWKFVKSMEKRAMHHMHWPRLGEEMERVKEGFRKMHGLPNCCGAIDVTHIVMELQVIICPDSKLHCFHHAGMTMTTDRYNRNCDAFWTYIRPAVFELSPLVMKLLPHYLCEYSLMNSTDASGTALELNLRTQHD